MINTLPTWQAQHAANTLSHNDVVRALGDAQAQTDALRAALRERDEVIDLCVSRFKQLARSHSSIESDDVDDIYEAVATARRVLGEVTG